jgi:hypothetical protein
MPFARERMTASFPGKIRHLPGGGEGTGINGAHGARAAAAVHPCPAIPQANQAITIGGVPARLLSMHCPPHSGFLVELAVTIHHGTAFVFASQNPTGTTAGDRAAFRKFLAGIRFQR